MGVVFTSMFCYIDISRKVVQSMRGMILRYLSTLLTVILFVAVTTGCSRNDITTESSATTESSTTELTLATLFVNPTLQKAVGDFNSSNNQYNIKIIDYSQFDTVDDYNIGYTKLATEIIAGKIPDIISLWPVLPVQRYIAMGLLEDLYPFLDADPEINRSDLIENVMMQSEIEGGFYRVFPGFSISTLVGSTSALGEEMGWTIEEFNDLLMSNPHADIPMGTAFDQMAFLTQLATVNIEQFVNRSEGTCSFDSDEFVRLLEIASTLPAKIDYMDEAGLIADGRQIMIESTLIDFRTIQVYKAMFASQIVFKGYPTVRGVGHIIGLDNALAMTVACSDKQGAWEFLRLFLTEEYQRQTYANYIHYFPSNQAAFNDLLELDMTPVYKIDSNGNEYEVSQEYFLNNYTVETFSVTQDEADLIIALIDSASFLENSFDKVILGIIRDSVPAYFAGQSSSLETAKIIQNRVSIFLAEQK